MSSAPDPGRVVAETSLALAVRDLLPHDAPLPWRAGAMEDVDQAGLIFDAHGVIVATVDVDRARPDAAAGCIAQAIVLSVNTACGHDTASNVGGAC